jgi:site-specific DNA-methyltransferase (adenine-specific)
MQKFDYHSYCDLLPEMTADDFNALVSDIKDNGLINPIVLFENQILDGKHRYKACLELGIEPKIETFTGNKEQALHFVISQNIARRHLLTGQKAALAINAKKEFEVIAKENQIKAGELGNQGAEYGKLGGRGITKDSEKYQEKISEFNNDDENNEVDDGNPLQEIFPEGGFSKKDDKKATEQSRDKAAKLFNVNPHYITDAEKIEKTDKEVFDKVKNGKLNIQEAKHLCKLDEPVRKKAMEKINNGEVKKVKDAVKKIKKDEMLEYSKSINDNDIPNDCRLIVKDIKELSSELEPDGVDLIITDPPYPKEYLYLYEELAKLAKYVLKDGGSMFVMCGQSYIPEIIEKIKPYMDYFWLFAYTTPGGQSAQIWNRKVNTFWKPILQFVKGKYNGEWVGDVIKSDVNDNDKEFHDWGQSESGMSDLIKRVSKPGDLILDPFLGGGTTGVVSIAMNRRFIGADISQEAINIAKARLYKKNGDNKIA